MKISEYINISGKTLNLDGLELKQRGDINDENVDWHNFIVNLKSNQAVVVFYKDFKSKPLVKIMSSSICNIVLVTKAKGMFIVQYELLDTLAESMVTITVPDDRVNRLMRTAYRDHMVKNGAMDRLRPLKQAPVDDPNAAGRGFVNSKVGGGDRWFDVLKSCQPQETEVIDAGIYYFNTGKNSGRLRNRVEHALRTLTKDIEFMTNYAVQPQKYATVIYQTVDNAINSNEGDFPWL